MRALAADPLPMAKVKKPARPRPPVYVGGWIRACESTPREVAKKTGINEGYLSQIISGQKDNPSGAILALIEEFLKIPRGTLYKPAPPAAVLDKIVDLGPEVIARLSKKRSNHG